jgi:tetratricopeptide (TPR) repeat protein
VAPRCATDPSWDARLYAKAAADLPLSLWPAPGASNRLAIALCEKALRLLDGREENLRALVSARLAAELCYHPQANRRRKELHQDLDQLTTQLCDRESSLKIACLRDSLLRPPDLIDKRLANADHIIHSALEMGDHGALYVGAMARAASLTELGEFQQADFEVEAAANSAGLIPDQRYETGILSYRAARAAMEGRFAEAESLFRSCCEISQRLKLPELVDACWPAMILPFREVDRLGELLPMARAAVDRHEQEPVYRAMLSWSLLELGDLREAEFHARVALENCSSRDPFGEPVACMTALSEVFASLGADVASDLYERLLPYSQRTATLASCAFFGAVPRYLGKLAASASQLDAAIAHLEEAIRMNDRLGARPWAAYSKYGLAAVLIQRCKPDDKARALHVLGSLYRDVATLGMVALAAKLEALLVELCESTMVSRSRETIKIAGANDRTPPSSSDDAGRSKDPSPRICRCEGDYWTLAYDAREVRLKAAKGLTLIAYLLSHPGERLHVCELEQQAQSSGRFDGSICSELGPMLDTKAKNSYRARLSNLRKELADARRFGDESCLHALEREAEFLSRELARAVGLGGHDRVSSEAERARLRVTNAIRSAVSIISRHHPTLGHHLKAYLSTGNFCIYAPNPPVLEWQIT